jgi:hypothetical protein
MAVTKSAQDIANGALGNVVQASKGGKLRKTIKKAKDNSKKIKGSMSKDLLNEINKAVPKGSSVDKIDESKIESSVIKAKDPLALAKEFKIDTSQFNALG